MFSIYTLFKFLHIAGAIVWIGASFALTVLNARIARAKDRQALVALSHHGDFFGRAVIAPAAGITFVAGIVMIARAGIPFSTLWIAWGLVGIFVSWFVFGAILLRKTNQELNALAPTAALDDPRLTGLQQRLAILNTINLLLLLSVVWAMVFKPTL